MALTQVAGGMLLGGITSSQISSVAGSTITGSQSIPKSTLPTGSVLQVVSTTFTTVVTVTASSDTDIGLTATITPSSASNKILVIASVIMYSSGTPSINVTSGWNIKTSANVTVIGGALFSAGLYQTSTTFNLHSTTAKHILHSPNTTSAITYKLTGRVNGATSATFNYTEGSDAPSCVLTLMEISA